MGRISNYQEDSVVGPKDKVVGSELIGYNSGGAPYYKTRNFTMFDIQTFVMGGSFEFASPITIQTTSAGNKKWIHDNITVSTPSAATSTLTHSGQFTVVTGITTDSYTEGVSVVTKGHVKQINTTTYTLPDYKFNIAADSNPGSDDAVIDINSSSFDTLNVLGGAVLTSEITADDTITIDHNEYTAKSITTDAVDVLHTFTSDGYGHVTAATKRTLPTMGSGNNYAVGLVLAGSATHSNNFLRKDGTWDKISFDIAADSPDASGLLNKEITNSETLTIIGGTYLTSQVSADNTITIKHDNASTLNVTNITSITNTGFGGTFTVMGSVGRDTQGHLTSARPVTVTIPNTLFTGPSGGNAGTIGLVPAPGTADGSKFLKGNGDWATVTQTSITSSNGTFVSLSALSAATGSVTIAPDLSATGIGANTAAKQLQFLRGDNTWATPPGTPTATTSIIGGIRLFNDTHPSATVNTVSTIAGRYYGIQTSGLTQGIINVPWVNTWRANSSTVEGYVASGANQADKVWKTNASGVPAWRTDADTTYSEATSSSEGLMSTAHHDKLGGIEDNATADQTPAQLRAAIGTGNGNLVPAEGTAGHFLKHDGTFGLPSYTTNTNTTYSNFTGATNNTFGLAGLVPAPGYGETALFLKSNGTWASTPDTNTTYSAGSGIDLSGTTFSLTQTTNTGNSYYKIPFMNNNVINVDNTTSHFSFNPSTNGLTVGKIGVGVTPFANTLSSSSNIDLIGNGGVLSYANTLYLTANAYYNGGWKAKTTGATGMLIVRSSDLRYFVDTSSQSAGAASSIVQVFRVSNGGNVTASGTYTGTNFIVSSDRRIKSGIEPIKQGLEVIKQFTSYNYIKDGKKESGFIAQEVQQVLPHTVYEDKEGMLSMSDRGVLAHMHKAILELEKRLTAIEEKLN